MRMTKKINKKIKNHVRKSLLRRGFSKKLISQTMLLDGKCNDIIDKLVKQGWAC